MWAVASPLFFPPFLLAVPIVETRACVHSAPELCHPVVAAAFAAVVVVAVAACLPVRTRSHLLGLGGVLPAAGRAQKKRKGSVHRERKTRTAKKILDVMAENYAKT